MRRAGFTLIEMTVALVILAIGILGIASSASELGRVSSTAQIEAVALQAVQDRIATVMLHPSYGALDSLFSGTEDGIPAEGYERVTDINRSVTVADDGQVTDYTRIVVTVDGPGLAAPISRSNTVGAP